MVDELDPGESLDVGARFGGGPTFTRDSNVEDAVKIEGHGGELYRDEIKKLAEAIGLEVKDNE